MIEAKTKTQAKRLRLFRKIHRMIGAFLFLFFFIVATSGLLLGWKKHSNGIILLRSFQGKSTNPADWMPLDELQKRAIKIAREEISNDISPDIDRIDVRPDKGMVKFLFVENYWGLQLDLTIGELLHFE